MAPDELALACRLSGLSLDDLWLRYLEIGGNRSRAELESRLGGAAWPPQEDRYLSVVADEALRERGLPRFAPPAVPTRPLPDGDVPGDDRDDLRATAAAVLGTRARGSQLTGLFERCARARERARRLREHAEAIQRECGARNWASPGG